MKANDGHIARALDRPDGSWKLALLYGPDDAGSRALADRLGVAMGADAERVDLDGATLKEDPARLTDEVTAMTMFGGARWVRVTGGEEVLAAVNALIDAPDGCPAVVVAGNLPKTSALAKLATAHPRLLAYQSWKPAGAQADAVATQIARTMGLRLGPDVARMLAEAVVGDRALMSRELEKLALYVDAAPDRPRAAERADFEAVGAGIDVRETWDAVDALYDGRVAAFAQEETGDAAADAIPTLRAMNRRALLVARALAVRRGGAPPRGNSREMTTVEQQVRHWTPAHLAIAHAQMMAAEAAIKRPHSAGDVVARYDMLRLARAASRRR